VSEGQRSIVLIGFMGSGKSSIGRLLARQQNLPVFDTDEMIAAERGMAIPAIFAKLGEERFRQAESDIVRKLDGSKAAIIVTGGGIVLRAENVRRLRELGTVVWLKTDLAVLRERLAGWKDRPLLATQNPAETIATLLEQRTKFYEEAADFAVDTSHLSHEDVAQVIRDGLQVTR
jgi:shikimate kinase